MGKSASMTKDHNNSMPNKNDWYVDEECIACDACVLVAEKHFKIDESGERAYVYCQPKNSKEETLCQEAMEVCPVEAIHRQKEPAK